MDRTNDVRKIAEEIARKKELHSRRAEMDRKAEKESVTRTAAERKKDFDKNINKKDFLPIFVGYVRLSGAALIVTLSAITLIFAWKTVSARQNNGISESGTIINPYRAGTHAKVELSMIDNEISRMQQAVSSSGKSVLKPIISGSDYNVLSITKNSEGTSATVEFIREGAEPVPLVFNWNTEGTLLKPKY